MEEKFERYRKLLKKRKSYDPSVDVDWDADPVIAEREARNRLQSAKASKKRNESVAE